MSILNKLPIDFDKLLSDVQLIGEGRPYAKYEEGVKTGIGGTAYNVLVPCLEYQTLTVKVAGELTPSVHFSGSPVPVKFAGVTGKAYQDFQRNGEIKLSIFADSVHVVEKNRLKMNKEED